MHFIDEPSFRSIFEVIQNKLVNQPTINVGEWQSIHKPMPMKELLNVVFEMQLPASMDDLAMATGAHRPWAEDHFEERVGGHPLNPSPSEAWWPFAQKKNDTSNGEHKSEGAAFSHTYPERMWPKFANKEEPQIGKVIREYPHRGIRFEYGDLRDVVNQLTKTPLTRQAYLPIWFPEDTGAVHGKRVPCTLGYHFIIRDGELNISYFMRSTDLLRHFQDDIYMAGRLAQWMVNQINARTEYLDGPQQYPLEVGNLTFHTANMHIFEADVPMIAYRKSQGQLAWPE